MDATLAIIDRLVLAPRDMCVLRVLLWIHDAEDCVGLKKNDIFGPFGMCFRLKMLIPPEDQSFANNITI
jgi:hypothetical protein